MAEQSLKNLLKRGRAFQAEVTGWAGEVATSKLNCVRGGYSTCVQNFWGRAWCILHTSKKKCPALAKSKLCLGDNKKNNKNMLNSKTCQLGHRFKAESQQKKKACTKPSSFFFLQNPLLQCPSYHKCHQQSASSVSKKNLLRSIPSFSLISMQQDQIFCSYIQHRYTT